MEWFFPSYSKYFEVLPFPIVSIPGGGGGDIGSLQLGPPFVAEAVLGALQGALSLCHGRACSC